MLCIHLNNQDPFFCLAAEEYLLKNFSDDIFMLWQSEKAVVVGKHQNLLAEINYPFVCENNIAVARRISGGGTVYHDAGNVNFSFIKNVKSPAEISFKQFTEPVVVALAKLGITATTSGRNDLLIEGLKFNSDLKNLGQAIKVVPGKYTSKAVQSNRSPVANISSFLKNELTIERFIQFLLDVQLENRGVSFYEPTENDIQNIQKLSKVKFETWEWNFGYSPKYSFTNKTEVKGIGIEVNLKAVKGIISEIEIGGDYFSKEIFRQLSKCLQEKRHYFEEIQQELKRISSDVPNELIYVFF